MVRQTHYASDVYAVETSIYAFSSVIIRAWGLLSLSIHFISIKQRSSWNVFHVTHLPNRKRAWNSQSEIFHHQMGINWWLESAASSILIHYSLFWGGESLVFLFFVCFHSSGCWNCACSRERLPFICIVTKLVIWIIIYHTEIHSAGHAAASTPNFHNGWVEFKLLVTRQLHSFSVISSFYYFHGFSPFHKLWLLKGL